MQMLKHSPMDFLIGANDVELDMPHQKWLKRRMMDSRHLRVGELPITVLERLAQFAVQFRSNIVGIWQSNVRVRLIVQSIQLT